MNTNHLKTRIHITFYDKQIYREDTFLCKRKKKITLNNNQKLYVDVHNMYITSIMKM